MEAIFILQRPSNTLLEDDDPCLGLSLDALSSIFHPHKNKTATSRQQKQGVSDPGNITNIGQYAFNE